MVNWSDAEICRKTIRNRKVLRVVWMKSAIVLCLIAEICSGIHFQGPSNTTVPEGARATLHCQTSVSKTVWWKYFKHDVFYAYAISYEYKSSHEAEMDVSRGIYNLIIRNASSHPGLYTCVDNDGEGESWSAWLTVARTSEETEPGNNTLLIAVCIPVCIVIFAIIVIVLAIVCKRCIKRCRDTDAATKQKEELHPLNPPSKDENALQPTKKEPEEGGTGNHTSSTENTHQKESPAHSTSTEIEEIKPSTTSTCVPSNSQTAASVSSPQEDPLAKPGMPPAEQKNLSGSAPVEKVAPQCAGAHTQADVLKPDRLKDGRPTPPPKPKKKTGESIVKPTETIVSQEEQVPEPDCATARENKRSDK